MPDSGFKYSENILQWIWKNLLFDSRELKTTKGKSISIYDQGELNHSDGPDFLNAKILIDGLEWHGAVELHLQSSGWKQHGHNVDDSYNKVVLHVVVENNPKSVYTSLGEELPTLNLLPHLPYQLSSLISKFDQSYRLPCSGSIRYISEEAFLKQIEKAHKEYLEKKGNDFLSFYKPELLPSIAWKYALVLSVFDGFGISNNREAMLKVGEWFLEHYKKNSKSVIDDALEFSGFGEIDSEINWNYKGVFPASHPKNRIVQAINMASSILVTPFDRFLEQNALDLWNTWANEFDLERNRRLKVLYGTVYIPSLYVLGNLFYHSKLVKLSVLEWNRYQVPIPKSITKSFDNFQDINPKTYRKKLGAVHQFNTYCKARRCHECFVLKKVILS